MECRFAILIEGKEQAQAATFPSACRLASA
jgi:hypothetical protein